MNKFIKDNFLTIIAILTAMSYWIIESIADSLIFKNQDLLEAFFSISYHEFYMRLIIVTLIILFGFYTNKSYKKIKRAEKREKELNSLLKSVRDINQLIVREKNTKKLLNKSREVLLNTRGYKDVHITIKKEKKVKKISENEINEPSFWEVKTGENQIWENSPNCVKKVFKTKEPQVLDNEVCEVCDFCDHSKEHKALAFPLKTQKEVLGILTVCVKGYKSVSDEEKKLLEEISNDLAFSLEKNRIEKKLDEERRLFVKGPTVVFRLENQEPYRIKYSSKNVKELLGYTKEELKKKSIGYEELIHSSDIDNFKNETKKQPLNKTIQLSPHRLKTKEDEIIWVKNYTKKTQNELIGYLVDITENYKNKEQLKTLKKQYEDLLNNIGDSIFLHKTNGDIIEVNRTTSKRLGYSISKLKNMNIREINDNSPIPKIEKRINSVLNNNRQHPYFFEATHLTSKGEKIPVEIGSTEIEFQGEKAILSVARDISKRKEIEKREKLLNSLLTHDLKNKMQVIIGYIDLLSENLEDKEDFDKIDEIKRAGEEILNISDNFRKIVETSKKINSQVITKDELEKLIKDGVRENNKYIRNQEIDIIYELDLCDILGGEYIKDVFSNLIENSIHHGKSNKIRISSKKNGEYCVITIEDDGKGIKLKDSERIFDIEYTEKPNTGGLGLNLIKNIVQVYHGEIKAIPSNLGGAAFKIKLKRAN